MHIRSLLISSLASIAWGFTAAVSAILYLPMLATEAITSMRWDWPVDARTSLAVDAISRRVHSVVDPARSMFRAFVERALGHPDYSSGHFDPGRMPT